MTLEMEIVNPTVYSQWDEIISSFKEYSFFHTAAWSKVLQNTYGYKPLYLVFRNGSIPKAIFPLMEISNPLQEKRGVALPFSDFCEPLNSDERKFSFIFNSLKELGTEKDWETLTFSSRYERKAYPIAHYYYLHQLSLQKNSTTIFKSFRDSNKRNIKRALNSNIRIVIGTSFDLIIEYYKLQCITRKKHGLPPQPFSFFEQIHKQVLQKSNGIVILAYYNGKVIAGAVFFSCRETVIFKFGASIFGYQHLRPNNLVMWKAIQYYCERGYREFSFGKTEPHNKGLLQFKNGWNTKITKLYKYKYHLKKKIFIKDTSKVYGIHNAIFQKTPVPMLQLVGTVLYKYTG